MDKRKAGMPWLCRVWGHDLDVDAAYYYGVDYCKRCELINIWNTGFREWIKVRLFVGARYVRDKYWTFCYWLKCSECGKRFGKHDADVSHLPF